MTISQLDQPLNEVFLFCKQYDAKTSSISTGMPNVRLVCANLNKIREQIIKSLPLDKFPKLTSSISMGSGNFPRVPWVSFHLSEDKVSNSLSVVICFSRDGCGLVSGLMMASELKTMLNLTKRTKLPGFLDIRGSSRTDYNNKFVNPREFFAKKLDINSLIKHISDSLEILYKEKSDEKNKWVLFPNN